MGKATRWLKGLFSGRGRGKKSKWVFTKSSKLARKELGFGGGGYAFFGGEVGLREEEEDKRRAIAMAAATAAVAEAAVAAAQAAADQVVRLAGSGRVSSQVSVRGTRMPEVLAAVRIQSAFRGCLARKALKALKGLVKLQALVRGRMVRKEAAETLRRMHALVKAQERARAYRGGGVLLQDAASDSTSNYSNLIYVYDDNTSESKLKWLKHWTEEEEEEASNDETNAKILEIDTGKPKIRYNDDHHHHLRYQQQYSLSSDQNYSNSRSSFMTVAQGSSVTSPSSVSTRQKNHPSSRPASALGRGGKRSLFNVSTTYPSDPNYMTYTESSRAKTRSQSAPRQRSSGLEKSSTQHCIKRPSSSSVTKLAPAKAYPGSGMLDRMGMPVNTCQQFIN